MTQAATRVTSQQERLGERDNAHVSWGGAGRSRAGRRRRARSVPTECRCRYARRRVA